MPSLQHTGFIGKLPSTGDFVEGGGALASRSQIVKRVQMWLQACNEMPEMRDIYLDAPLWRFASAGGILCDLPVAGVICPSADSVGRIFPLTVVTELEDGTSPMSAAQRFPDWFLAMEEAALDALDPDMTPVAFQSMLHDPPPLPKPRIHFSGSTVEASLIPITVDERAVPVCSSGVASLLEDADIQADTCDTIWMTLGSRESGPYGFGQFGKAYRTLFADLIRRPGDNEGDSHGTSAEDLPRS